MVNLATIPWMTFVIQMNSTVTLRCLKNKLKLNCLRASDSYIGDGGAVFGEQIA